MAHETAGRQNGWAIRAFREKEELTVPELASLVGLHQQGLRNIENGTRPASTKVIRRLARVLDVPIAAITKDGTSKGIAEADADEIPAESRAVA